MPRTIAEHEFVESGWHWIYELYPDRLVLISLRGEERQQFQMELRHAGPTPDRWLEEYGARYPQKLVFSAIGFITVTVLLCLALPAFVRDIDVRSLWCAAVIFVVLALLLVLSTPRIAGVKHFRRLVRFNRISDGGELLRISSELNPRGQAFEEFIAQVSAATSAFHEPRDREPPPSHTFRAVP